MRRTLRRIAFSTLFLLVLIQLWPAGRSNPPTTAGLDAPPEVTSILRRACFDCHSNETRWPWYSYVAPVSWWMVHDVDEGRAELNFSDWGSYEPKKRERRSQKVIEEIENGAMPPDNYLRLHGDARLSAGELEILRKWVEAPR